MISNDLRDWNNIPAIEQGGLDQTGVIEVEDVFELPLQEAGRILWDKGITTIMSGANHKQGFRVDNDAYIIINFDNLSEANKEIAVSNNYEIVPMTWSTVTNTISLRFDMQMLSPQGVSDKMVGLANVFQEQQGPTAIVDNTKDKTFRVINKEKTFRITS